VIYQILNIYNFIINKMADSYNNLRNGKIMDFFINSLSITVGLLFFVLLVYIYIKYGIAKSSNLKNDDNNGENLDDISDLFDDV